MALVRSGVVARGAYEAAQPHPGDIVLDAVGGELLNPAIRSLAPGGRLVAFSSGGGTIDAYELLNRGASAIGFQIAAIARDKPHQYAHWRDELWDLHRQGTLRTHIHAEIPLTEAAHAHHIIESRRNLGKVVLVTHAQLATTNRHPPRTHRKPPPTTSRPPLTSGTPAHCPPPSPTAAATPAPPRTRPRNPH